MNLTQAIPCFIGGFLVSSAIGLNNKFGIKETEPARKSFFNMFTIDPTNKWRTSFIAGMLFAAALAANVFGLGENKFLNIKPFENDKVYFQGTSLLQCMLAAFLMGLGTRLAQENLSKYAFYALPANNRQSIYCMLFTFVVAAITATFRSSIPILQGFNLSKKFSEVFDFRLPFLIPFVMLLVTIAKNYSIPGALKQIFFSFGMGNLLASGLMIAGLTKRHQVLDFLSLNKNWNPSIFFFFIGAWLCYTWMFRMMPSMGTSTSSDMPSTAEESSRTITSIPGLMNPKVLLGCTLFGIGKGMTGLFLGSALLVSPVYFPHAMLFILPSILGGQLVGGMFDKMTTKITKGTKEL